MTYQSPVEMLGVPTRRAIFERLRGGPMPVGELAHGLPVSRPAVSQHLKALKAARLVRDRRMGTRRVYSINPEGLMELRDYLETFWKAALAGFKAAAESERRKKR